MKIAFIGTEGIPGNYGGFETFVDNISYRLCEKGHEVTVFQPDDHKVDLKNSKYEKVKIQYIRCPKNKYLRGIIKRIFAYLMIKREFDIVHNFGPFSHIFKLFNKKAITVATIDGFEWNRTSYNMLTRKYIKASFVKSVVYPKIAIVDSIVVHNFFEENGIKTQYLPYGTNFIEQVYPLSQKFIDLGLEKENYVYFVGRFVPEKNISRLISDFMQIKTPKKLVIIGKGIIGEKYEESIRNLSKDDKRIIYPGPLYGADYINLISNSLGYVSSSKLEGTSPALLDALGARKRVLVSNIAENQATLNNLGHYYPLEDKVQSIIILEKFVNNELYINHEYEDLMKFAFSIYDWNNIVDKYIQIVGEKIENK